MSFQWDQIREEYAPLIARVVASYSLPGPDREDLGQEVALALFRALPAFRGDSSPRTYI
ncbi:MAG: sigma-70 family RNA polymerase sigma factor [Proteobacteria bacterium]|jgi:DNA-directed RNA polymerase specialized sigma24 family protein|nr:sigma-70 family RNA polymerase sigma factor [Pseudomonadota bacterium]